MFKIASLYNRKWLIVLLHVTFWLLFFSLPFLIQAPGDNREMQTRFKVPHLLLNYFLRNLLWVILFYTNAYFFIPRFYYQRKLWAFLGCQISSYLIIISAGYLLHILFIPQQPMNWRAHVVINLLFYLFFFASSMMYQLIRDREKNDRLNKEKETENLKTELSLLRSQASPHFMFNVLNNMVALARKKSDLLEPSLIKLSSLMRYMIYEAEEDKVPLEKEIEYLQSYIDLQRQRFGKNVQIALNVHTQDQHYEIEPMLLIPFVENAIKHGTGMIENAKIDIDLSTQDKMLTFMVRNKYNPASEEIRDKSSGIGLTNVKRRLKLLYGKKQELLISKNDEIFSIVLKINLN